MDDKLKAFITGLKDWRAGYTYEWVAEGIDSPYANDAAIDAFIAATAMRLFDEQMDYVPYDDEALYSEASLHFASQLIDQFGNVKQFIKYWQNENFEAMSGQVIEAYSLDDDEAALVEALKDDTSTRTLKRLAMHDNDLVGQVAKLRVGLVIK